MVWISVSDDVVNGQTTTTKKLTTTNTPKPTTAKIPTTTTKKPTTTRSNFKTIIYCVASFETCLYLFITILVAYNLLRTLSDSSWVYSVAFDSNDILASGTDDSTIKLWNKNTGDLMSTFIGHGSWVMSVAFDADDILASGSDDSTIKFWGQ